MTRAITIAAAVFLTLLSAGPSVGQAADAVRDDFGHQARRPVGPPPGQRNLFDTADVDGDGLISREELAAALKQSADPRVDRMFGRADRNGDGLLSREEMREQRDARRQRRGADNQRPGADNQRPGASGPEAGGPQGPRHDNAGPEAGRPEGTRPEGRLERQRPAGERMGHPMDAGRPHRTEGQRVD